MLRYNITITGIVQGVGFRPLVYKLAKKYNLHGYIKNIDSDVFIDVQGNKKALKNFINDINNNPPELSEIENFEVTKDLILGKFVDFEILKSDSINNIKTYISPDISICEDCEKEITDVTDRRYYYSFSNCTNCGPRFTIIKKMPYDRINTTMHIFDMCKKCYKEYKNPNDRRYHAQPTACSTCGPNIKVYDKYKNIQYSGNNDIKTIYLIEDLILKGNIMAIKGLGGYHLVCNARNSKVVFSLRKRKKRDFKPFALMAENIDIIKEYCYVNKSEEKILKNNIRPIVLLKKRINNNLTEIIAPSNKYLGFMLPYTPFYKLLFNENKIDLLVVTSGNVSNEPIFYDDKAAFEGLKFLADYFVPNNREINSRTDDSVAMVVNDKEYIIRRSRGYVPKAITINLNSKSRLPGILSCGGELKSNFCINKENNLYLSQHIGDLENLESFDFYCETIELFKNIFNFNPTIIVCDMHNNYLSTKYAKQEYPGLKIIQIQHHHAHIAACMVDNNLSGEVIGVAFDGSGLGLDNNIWGGEFFTGDLCNFERIAYFNYTHLPGGERAIKEPWRMAISYLWDLEIFIQKGEDICFEEKFLLFIKEIRKRNILRQISDEKIRIIVNMIDKGVNSPLTSSVGRLFEGISSMLNIRDVNNYEGQSAVELENRFLSNSFGYYNYYIYMEESVYKIDFTEIIKGVVDDILCNTKIDEISSKFHETISQIVCDICSRIHKIKGLKKVVLSGGVFQNISLLKRCIQLLENKGFEVFIHNKVPTNDGCISIGQSAIVLSRFINGLLE
ncbi:MAG: carbamoyltransferase HypF [Clostridiales bacterium]